MNILEPNRFRFEAGKGISAAQLQAMSNSIDNLIENVNYLLLGVFDVNREFNMPNATYTLEEAVALVSERRRAQGMKIRFRKNDDDNENLNDIFVEYSYVGSSLESTEFNNPDNWTSGIDYIDGGEF